jgi:hypothetical protein
MSGFDRRMAWQYLVLVLTGLFEILAISQSMISVFFTVQSTPRHFILDGELLNPSTHTIQPNISAFLL